MNQNLIGYINGDAKKNTRFSNSGTVVFPFLSSTTQINHPYFMPNFQLLILFLFVYAMTKYNKDETAQSLILHLWI